MSDHDPALIEKAAKALHEHDMFDVWDSSECNEVPDNGGGSCKQDYLDKADAVLDAVADDLRAEAWDEGHRGGELDGSYRLAVHAGFRAPAPGHLNPYRKEADRD